MKVGTLPSLIMKAVTQPRTVSDVASNCMDSTESESEPADGSQSGNGHPVDGGIKPSVETALLADTFHLERRLVMNRKSAQVRRAHKKAKYGRLEKQVKDLTHFAERSQHLNKALMQKVKKLESDLALAQKTSELLAARLSVRQDRMRLEARRSNLLALSGGGGGDGGGGMMVASSFPRLVVNDRSIEFPSTVNSSLTCMPPSSLAKHHHEAVRRRLLVRQATPPRQFAGGTVTGIQL